MWLLEIECLNGFIFLAVIGFRSRLDEMDGGDPWPPSGRLLN